MMMKSLFIIIFFSILSYNMVYAQQPSPAKFKISIDVGHGQIFWGDPSETRGIPANRIERIRYLTSQLQQNASSLNAKLVFLHENIIAADLNDSDLLFIHVPSSQYSEEEVAAITDFLVAGGSLFLVMEVDGWATLNQANVNDIIRPFGIQFGSDSPDSQVGGRTREGLITKQALKIPYHGGRVVSGGTPFCFGAGPEPFPFGVFTELQGGGKIIAMGDAMASLYMNSWQGVDDYKTQDFMQAALRWLLE